MVAPSVRNGALQLIPGVKDGGYAAVLGGRTLKEHRAGGIYQWSPPRRSRRPKSNKFDPTAGTKLANLQRDANHYSWGG